MWYERSYTIHDISTCPPICVPRAFHVCMFQPPRRLDFRPIFDATSLLTKQTDTACSCWSRCTAVLEACTLPRKLAKVRAYDRICHVSRLVLQNRVNLFLKMCECTSTTVVLRVRRKYRHTLMTKPGDRRDNSSGRRNSGSEWFTSRVPTSGVPSSSTSKPPT